MKYILQWLPHIIFVIIVLNKLVAIGIEVDIEK